MKKNFEINKIIEDEFGRKSGVLMMDKPKGITSHDLVYKIRREYGIKKVGHAGTLDPFASGKMIILIGKATTLSDEFLGSDKEYVAEIALGIKTHTLDIEGDITEMNLNFEMPSKNSLEEILKSFSPSYEQFVPLFSSVKINGQKLYNLSRGAEKVEIEEKENSKFVTFHKGTNKTTIKLPSKTVKIIETEVLEISEKSIEDYSFPWSEKFIANLKEKNINKIPVAKVRIVCSKGTYIRKLAEDIGDKLNIPASLVGLERTRIII